MRRLRLCLSIGVVTCLLAARASAQSGSGGTAPGNGVEPAVPIAPEVVTRDGTGRVTVRATRIAQPIRIDGRLDDRAYTEIQPVNGFIQQEPDNGAPATEPSDVWVLFDDDNIYITCRCWDSHSIMPP